MSMVHVERPDGWAEVEMRNVGSAEEVDQLLKEVGPATVISLDLCGGSLSKVPGRLRQCKHLRSLRITGCAIGRVPKWVDRLQKLDWLFIEP